MREAIPAIAAAAVIALIVGAAGMYFLMAADAPKEMAKVNENSQMTRADSDAEALKPRDSKPDEVKDTARTELETQLAETKKSLGKVADENGDLRAERDQLAKDKEALDAKVEELEARVGELKELAAGPNRLLISFGKWAELKEVREADWNDLGDAYAKMTPLLKEYANALAQGKPVDPETGAKIRQQNERLIAYYAKVIGKLPTHASSNGEFTHPINLVNILAGQLAEAGMPLSESQMQELAKLGDEFDKRWAALEAGYTENTWALQKLMDEAELKQWFYDEMFRVTTAEQRATAVPPELQGLIGLDLYSPGLMLQGNMLPLRKMDLPTLKTSLKDSVSEFTTISRESLDGAEYIFDDWLNALQLQPMTQLELARWRTEPVLKAGKAQLTALQALDVSVVVDEEVRKKFRFAEAIVVPQLVKQE